MGFNVLLCSVALKKLIFSFEKNSCLAQDLKHFFFLIYIKKCLQIVLFSHKKFKIQFALSERQSKCFQLKCKKLHLSLKLNKRATYLISI